MLDTMTGRCGQAEKSKKTRQHFACLEHIAACRDLTPTYKVVLMRLGQYAAEADGWIKKKYGWIADDAGVSERTAMRAIAAAEALGLIEVERGNGRSHHSLFRFLTPPERVTGQTGFEDRKGDTLDTERVTGWTEKGDRLDTERVTGQTNILKEERTQRKKEPKEDTSSALTRESDRPHDGFVSDRHEGKKPSTDLFDQPSKPKRPCRRKNQPGRFDEFWAIYPIHKSRGQAEQAYIKALKTGVTEQDLIDGAKRYAIEKAGQGFVKHPATWLNGKCWLDEPTPPAPAQQNGSSTLRDQVLNGARRAYEGLIDDGGTLQ